MDLRGAKLGSICLAALLAAGICATAGAQRRGAGEHWQQRQDKHPDRPSKPPKQDRQVNRPPRNETHAPPQNTNTNRPPARGNQTSAASPTNSLNGPVAASGNGVPPRWMERLRDMGPAQQERFLQNNQKFNSLSQQQREQVRRNLQHWNGLTPQQRMDVQDRERVWERMTPEQRAHVRNDVMPAWRQMPQERKQVIQQKLRVLQNMPESARNQRLNDPNFTRGMSAEDKSMLKDLSHLHVGGEPEPPQENPQE